MASARAMTLQPEAVDLLVAADFLLPMTAGVPVVAGAEVAIRGDRIVHAGPARHGELGPDAHYARAATRYFPVSSTHTATRRRSYFAARPTTLPAASRSTASAFAASRN